jgi:erythromycin esterase
VDTALFEALKFIERVDATEAGALHARLDGILTSLRFDFDRSGSASNYDGLNERQRDALTVAIADLVNLMEVREGRYTAASSNTEYEWAHRAAIGARQVDGWLRHVPPGGFNATDPLRAQSERTQFQSSAGAVRDRAQADNLEWILKQEGPQGKVLVFAHRYHLSGTPVRANWLGTYQQDVMGTYLRRRFGERLLTICNLIGEGEVECGGRQCCDGVKQSLGRRPPESIEALADQVGAARFLLDLRTAPRPVAKWLDEVRPLGRGTLGQGHDELHVSVARAFDVLLYLDVVTSACSCRSHVDSTD